MVVSEMHPRHRNQMQVWGSRRRREGSEGHTQRGEAEKAAKATDYKEEEMKSARVET